MNVTVDTELCEANGICMRVCPSVFDVDDSDVLHIRAENIIEDQHEAIREAAKRCPRLALRIEEDAGE